MHVRKTIFDMLDLRRRCLHVSCALPLVSAVYLATVVTSHIWILEHACIDDRVVEMKPWSLCQLCNTSLTIVNPIPPRNGEHCSYIDALLTEHITFERRTMTGLDLGVRPVDNVVLFPGLPDGNEDIIPTIQ